LTVHFFVYICKTNNDKKVKIMESKVNKAQEKRDRQNFDYINSDLRRRLATFENEYLNGSVQYEFISRKNQIKSIQKEIQDFINAGTIDNRCFVKNSQHRIDMIQRELDFNATLTMNALNSSKRNYDEKVNRLAKLLVEEGFGYSKYKVEEIRNQGSRLEFLISNEIKEIHARLIWVDAVEVAPHFRFITTTRKK